MPLKISKNSQENTYVKADFLIKLPATLLKRYSGTGVFQWILRNLLTTFLHNTSWRLYQYYCPWTSETKRLLDDWPTHTFFIKIPQFFSSFSTPTNCPDPEHILNCSYMTLSINCLKIFGRSLTSKRSSTNFVSNIKRMISKGIEAT